MAIDKAEWHYGGKWPVDLPKEQANIHIGLYLAWIIDRNLQSSSFEDIYGHLLPVFKARRITGPQLLAAAGGVLSEDDMTDEAAEFSINFYDTYMAECHDVIDTGESGYEAKDTWDNCAKIETFLDEHFAQWKSTSGYKPTVANTVGLNTLLELVAAKTHYSIDECNKVYHEMLEVLANEFASKQRVTFEGFGTFENRMTKTPSITVNGSGEIIPETQGFYIGFSSAMAFKKMVDEQK